MHLTINSDMSTVVKTMARVDSGLEVRDRMWLKITIPNAFIGGCRIENLNPNTIASNLVNNFLKL